MKKLIKYDIWSVAVFGTENWTLRKIGQKYLESFEMWRWRRMDKVSCADRVRNEEVLHRVKKDWSILSTVHVTRRKANWVRHVMRMNCLLKNVFEGKIEGMRRRGRRHKQPLDECKANKRYWNLKFRCLAKSLWKRLSTCRRYSTDGGRWEIGLHTQFWIREPQGEKALANLSEDGSRPVQMCGMVVG
jgi:hypothetical protein